VSNRRFRVILTIVRPGLYSERVTSPTSAGTAVLRVPSHPCGVVVSTLEALGLNPSEGKYFTDTSLALTINHSPVIRAVSCLHAIFTPSVWS